MAYIQTGNVSIMYPATDTVFKVLGKDALFGEVAFFLGTPRTASAQCLNYVSL
jgi:CRP-like cAMP-binding protein